MTRGLVFSAFLLTMGCGDPWSPIGTYEVVQVWQSGTCFLFHPRVLNFAIRSVEDGASNFEVIVDNPDVDTETTVLQSNDNCTLSFELTEPPNTGIPLLGIALTVYNIVETDGNLEGSGIMVVSSPDSCFQNFTVEGTKQ